MKRVASTIIRCQQRLLGIAFLVTLVCGSFAAEEQGNVQELFQQGQQALAQGNYPRAQAAFEELATLQPGLAEVHANLGLIYFEQRRFNQAIPELRRALKLKPALTNSGFILAMSLSERGDFAEALPGLEKGFRSADREMKRMCGLQLERAYTGLKRDSDAVKTALEMERLYPNDPEVQYHDSKIFGNFAFLTIQKLWSAAPDSIWRHQAEGEALESQGSYEAAIGQYRDVLTRDPKRPGIHYRLGRIHLARSQKGGSAEDATLAKQEFEKELELDPGNGNAAYELAEMARNAGQYDVAETFFEAALKGHADFEEAHLGLAATLIALQKPDIALSHLKDAIALNHENEVTWWRLAQAERALGNSDEQKRALIEFRRLHAQTSPGGNTRDLFSPKEVTQQQLDANAPQ